MTTDNAVTGQASNPACCSAADAPIETMRCDVCNCLLASVERAEVIDTGFRECRDCSIKRHLTCSSETTDRNGVRRKCRLPAGHDGQHLDNVLCSFRFGRRDRVGQPNPCADGRRGGAWT